ncbi:MAG: hypothetical protein J5518_01830 [Lachnospiraceae bacterium]|nr:hypothetical protein [Lachnospiraceae bacterium]
MSVEFEEKVLSKLDKLEERTDALKEKMQTGFDSIGLEFAAVRKEMQVNSDEINGKIDKLEHVVSKHTEQIDQLNKKVGIGSATA